MYVAHVLVGPELRTPPPPPRALKACNASCCTRLQHKECTLNRTLQQLNLCMSTVQTDPSPRGGAQYAEMCAVACCVLCCVVLCYVPPCCACVAVHPHGSGGGRIGPDRVQQAMGEQGCHSSTGQEVLLLLLLTYASSCHASSLHVSRTSTFLYAYVCKSDQRSTLNIRILLQQSLPHF